MLGKRTAISARSLRLRVEVGSCRVLAEVRQQPTLAQASQNVSTTSARMRRKRIDRM
jgi:hypothetical protein